MHLLGGVDQEEEQGERSSSDARQVRGELRRVLDQLIESWRAGRSVPSRAAARSQAVDNRESFITFQSLNDSAKSAAEIPDILVKRKIFAADVLHSRCVCGISHRE